MVLLLPGESQTLIAPVSKARKEVSNVSKCSAVELIDAGLGNNGIMLVNVGSWGCSGDVEEKSPTDTRYDGDGS